MSGIHLFRSGLVLLTILAAASCTTVQPAGSLGYALDGETRLRPTPENYRHVPPRREDANPTPMQWGLSF